MGRIRIRLVVLAALAALVPVQPADATADFDVFVVTSTADTGDNTPDGVCGTCTLREAIQEANANNNPDEVDVIAFGISGAGTHTIAPTSELPSITQPVLIDGYSQNGASPNTATNGSTNAVPEIILDGAAAPAVSSGLRVSGQNVTIRGLVIGGWDLTGIEVQFGASAQILGNFIGTNATATVANPNGTFGSGGGIGLSSEAGTVIGGDAPADRNVLSGNTASGVEIPSSNAKNVSISGNLIGTKADGTSALGNGTNGLLLRLGPKNDHITVTNNTIAFNGTIGVNVLFNGSGVTIAQNSIHNNDDLGIDFEADGATENDPKDVDIGANHHQNFPDLTSAQNIAGSLHVIGKLKSTPSRRFTIEFFANAVSDASGNGEGDIFLGSKTVRTNTKGVAKFSADVTTVPAGFAISSTATDVGRGDTSEFSDDVTAT